MTILQKQYNSLLLKLKGGFSMNEMTEELLRQALKEAEKKGQQGLLIWSNWSIWEEIEHELDEGDERYNLILSQVEKGKEVILPIEYAGFQLSACIAVSVKKLSNVEGNFETILAICRQNSFCGPFTLLPLNELADCC